MSAFILSPETVWNPKALETGSVPRKVLDRIAFLPKGGGAALAARVIFENEPLRYFIALSPFVVAMFIWRDLALPISQAPVAMIIVIGFFEMKVLRVSAEKRKTLMDEDDAARVLDTLNFRARRVLTKLAAQRGQTSGELMLVVEQSELAHITPLTLVSVQTREGKPRILPLALEERDLIAAELFGSEFTERLLHRANLREDVFLRSVSFDARGVSGHARLAALLDGPAPQEAPA
jgi:ribosomal protein L18